MFQTAVNGIAATARVLLDTDVLIDHLAKRHPISREHDGAYSSIARAELYSHSSADEAVIDRLLNEFEEIPVDRHIAEEAGRIRRTTRIKLPYAIVAASAILSKRSLLTRNVRDFRRVDRLRLNG